MRSTRPRILFLESFYGGSHRDFADGLLARTDLRFDLETLPARFWKWRLRSAALHFTKAVPHPETFDLVFTSSMTNAADLKAIWGPCCPPVAVYFHENQLSYPLAPGESRDYQYGFSDLLASIAADAVIFNSGFQRSDFLTRLDNFLSRMPDFQPAWATEEIREKSEVLYPGCQFRADPPNGTGTRDTDPPLIIWNHRWEFDKAPEVFFDALAAVANRGIDFRLALLGEQFSRVPEPFRSGCDRFAGRIVHSGFVPSKKQYYEWLQRGTVMVSSAIQENFGIAVVEAMRFGCLPLLPERLVYPEIVPDRFHRLCLYRDPAELVERLCRVLRKPEDYHRARSDLAHHMRRFSWDLRAPEFDRCLRTLIKGE